MELKDKRIVITGGTSGVGYEMAKIFSGHNEVLVISRSQERLEKLSDEIKGVVTFQADLSKLDEVDAVAREIALRFNSLDVLINNAAVQHVPTFIDEQFDIETINAEITLNFTSICFLTYLLIPLLRHKHDATILNVNSGLALAPKTTSAVYCATKAALNSFTLSLRYQLSNTNINVQQVFLDLIDTAMTKGRGSGKRSPEDAATKIFFGIENNISDHYIGKVALLQMMLRITPSITKKIMKKQ